VRTDDDWIVEIGAGLGTLTARLAERVPEGKVIALERDRDMVAVLRAELGTSTTSMIEPGDALRYDLAACARWRGEPIVVCGNLPYNVAAPLMFRTDRGARPRRARGVHGAEGDGRSHRRAARRQGLRRAVA
jgi:16S rRNA (adenine1518-N6/adenine1519-N6)-dimethyltransferase